MKLLTVRLLFVVILPGCAALDSWRDPQDVAKMREERKREMVEVFEQKRDATQYQAALARWQQADAQGCRELVEQLLVRNPRHLEGRLLRIELLLDQNQPDRALTDVETLLADYPDHATTHHLAGLVYDALGERERAVAQFKAALEQEPDNELFLASLQSVHEPMATAQISDQP